MKISEMQTVSPAEPGDFIPVVRGSGNFKVELSDIADFVGGPAPEVRVYVPINVHPDVAGSFGPAQAHQAPAPVTGTIVRVGFLVDISVDAEAPAFFYNNTSFEQIAIVTWLAADPVGTFKQSAPVSVAVAKNDILYVALNGFPGPLPTFGRAMAFFDIQP